MATDTAGTIMVSGANNHGFNAKSNLVSAFKNIQANKPLSFQEEYSVESLWHEILHNRAEGYALTAERSISRIHMETLNQFVARHTYHEFLEQLGGKAIHQAAIIEGGLGYSSYVKNFRTLLSKLKINEQQHLESLKQFSYKARWNVMTDLLSAKLATLSGNNSVKISLEIKKALCAIHLVGESMFKVLMDELFK
jgi:hypothetical protein